MTSAEAGAKCVAHSTCVGTVTRAGGEVHELAGRASPEGCHTRAEASADPITAPAALPHCHTRVEARYPHPGRQNRYSHAEARHENAPSEVEGAALSRAHGDERKISGSIAICYVTRAGRRETHQYAGQKHVPVTRARERGPWATEEQFALSPVTRARGRGVGAVSPPPPLSRRSGPRRLRFRWLRARWRCPARRRCTW